MKRRNHHAVGWAEIGLVAWATVSIVAGASATADNDLQFGQAPFDRNPKIATGAFQSGFGEEARRPRTSDNQAGAGQDWFGQATSESGPDEFGQANGAPPASGAESAPPPEEIVAEGLGLGFLPPSAAFLRTNSSDGVLRYELIDGRDQPRWRMRIQGLVASRADATVASQLEDYLASMRSSGQAFTVRLDEEIRPAAGEPGRLLLLANDLGDGAVGVSGWALFPRGEGVFLVMSLLANEADLDAILPSLRSSLASVRLLSAETVERDRRHRVERGAAMLAAITPERLRAVATGEPSWFRVSRAATGDRPEAELGYVRLRAREGRRGEVDATRSPDSFRGEDVEAGFLVELDARTLVPDRTDHFTVTQARFWLAWDRSSELWSVRTARHAGRNVANSAETGLRTAPLPGAPRARLTVITANAEKAFRQPEEWPVPPNYLGQAEQQVLGLLLPAPPESGESFILYAYDPKTGSLPQRTESWRTESGRRVLETRLSGGPVSLRREFDASGRLVRRIDSEVLGDVVTEAIAPEALETLYRRKGLKVE
jgi:hypothetical protein